MALYFIEPTGYRKGLLDGLILIVREDSGYSPDTAQYFHVQQLKVNGKLQQAEICRTSEDSDPLRMR